MSAFREADARLGAMHGYAPVQRLYCPACGDDLTGLVETAAELEEAAEACRALDRWDGALERGVTG